MTHFLDYFDLANQPICATLGDILYKAISNSQTIRCMNLSNTRLGQCSENLYKILSYEGLKLCSLSLSNNNLSLEQTQNVLEIIATFKEPLLEFDYSGNPLGEEGAVLFREFLLRNPHVSYLDLSNTHLTDRGFQIISQGLSPAVKVLMLRNNGLTMDSKDTLRQVARSVRVLDISWNEFIGGNIGEAVEGLDQLESINICSSQIKTSMPKVICSLAQCPNLRVVKLSSNYSKFSCDGCLLNLLSPSSKIEELDLFSNYFDETSSQVLGNALKHNVSLKTLTLGNVGLTPQSIYQLAEGLKENHTLETLVLFLNQVEDLGCEYLADMLKVNRSLKFLTLWECGIDDEGFIALSEALLVNNTLETLDVRDNDGEINIFETYAPKFKEVGKSQDFKIKVL